MDPSSPFKVNATQDGVAGYTLSACVECSDTTGVAITKDNWTVKQSPDCNQLITPVTAGSVSAYTLTYDNVTPSP